MLADSLRSVCGATLIDPDTEPPVQSVRFQVKNVGNAYHVVDLVTNKTKAFRWTYAAAVDFAMQLEEKAKREPGGAK
ncbi:hypothetical protein [Pseudomonas sp. G(2018)]|uniref:hypothetical protein n=1 Tax=Pseudomonas sp. G(2018) TaxID=2502242 RepID=UPI0010F5DBCB|nr:hypothetical protein [Pseudomonas sp. G(2018)]